MKKYFYCFSLILFAFVCMNSVDAVSASINIRCNSLKFNKDATCNVFASVSGGQIEGVSVDSLDVVSGSDVVIIKEDYISILANDSKVNNGDKLGYFTVKSIGYGTSKVSLALNAKSSADGSNVSIKPGVFTFNILSPVATLSSITVNGSLINGFSSTVYKYNVDSISSDSVSIGAVATAPGTSVKGTGNHKLKCGSNTLKINTVSGDKSKKLTYTLNINKKCDDNTSLKGITLSSGTLSPVFSADTLEYKVSVDTNVEKMSIDVSKEDNQKVSGLVKDAKLAFGDNTFSIKVTSESGKSKTYKIVVNRADNRSNNALLGSITIDNGKLNFDRNVFMYDVRVLNEVSTINVVATPEDSKAKVEVDSPKNLKEGDNKVVIKVTAENGATQEYSINVKRLKVGEVLGDNPNIANIIITGYNINFNPMTTSYNLKLDNKTKSLSISVVMQEEGATYQINGNNDLKNGDIITINTTSMDGTQNTYKIIIEKSNAQMFILIGAGVLLVASISAIIVVMVKKRKGAPGLRLDSPKKDKTKDIEMVDAISNQDSVSSEVEEINNKINTLREETDELKEQEKNNGMEKNLKKYKKDTSGPMSFDQLRELDPTQNGQSAYGNHGHSEEYERIEITEDQTKQCPKCGHRINFSSKVCPYCGKEFQ